MRLQQSAARLGLVVFVVISGFLLWRLAEHAGHAYARRDTAAAATAALAEPWPADASWRLVFQLDRSGGLTPTVLTEGWSAVEPGSGVWSAAKQVVLQLPPPPSAGPLKLTLRVQPFLPVDRPYQRVGLRIGDQPLGEWRLERGEMAPIDVDVPAGVARPGEPLVIRLDLPDADAPNRTLKTSTDSRPVAIKLSRITLSG